jgi:hypothetical protein
MTGQVEQEAEPTAQGSGSPQYRLPYEHVPACTGVPALSESQILAPSQTRHLHSNDVNNDMSIKP